MASKHEYIAPVKWQSITSLPVIAARLELTNDEKVTKRLTKQEYLFFPIDNQHFVVFIFYPARSANGTEADIDKKIGGKNLEMLISNIIDSVKIKLSPKAQAQAQQEKALEDFEDTALTKEFLPMKW